MAKNKRYISKQFPAIEHSLQKIAKNKNVSEVVVIEQFKKDMQNFNEEGYEKIIKEITIKKISDPMRMKLIEFLDELIKEKKAKERSDIKKVEKQESYQETKESNEAKWSEVNKLIEDIIASEGKSKLETILFVAEQIKSGRFNMDLTKKQKNYILKKLKEMENDETQKQQEKAAEVKMKNEANKIWEQISEKVRTESENGEKPEIEYWIAIRKMLFGEEEGKIRKNLKISKAVKSRVKKMLDDEVYYQDVKYYTKDFKFLRDFPEVALGSLPRRGFFDTECLLRYTDLREQLQIEWDEETGIKKMLKNNPDDATQRILQARAEAIKKEKDRRREGRDY